MADYPSANPAFTTLNDGVDYPQADDLNSVYREVEAIGAALRDGVAHDVLPDSTAGNRDLGSTGQKFRDVHLSGDANVGDALAVTGNATVGGTLAVTGALSPAAGIAFPATQAASVDPNRLDDYEENSWTPTDASGAGLTFSTVEGHYVKIGQLVIATMTLTFPATGNGSVAIIGGLPFTVQNSTNNLFVGAAITNAAFSIYAQPLKNTTTAQIFSQAGAGNITNANLTGAIVRFTVAYRATA